MLICIAASDADPCVHIPPSSFAPHPIADASVEITTFGGPNVVNFDMSI